MPASDTTIDVHHLGRVEYVSSHVFSSEAGPILLDTGPASTIETLELGLSRLGFRVADIHAILLSHIHLDHAGAAGLLVDRNPRIVVYVHHLGARHLIDPTKLIASATRFYGDKMDRSWGKFLAVPEANIRELSGGELVEIGDRRFEVIHSPGHASHHVSYYDRANRTAYIGDTGGIRVPALPVTLPVTPPPDFDLESWLESINQIRRWRPKRVFRTNYGFDDEPEKHLEELRQGLLDWTAAARSLLADPGLTDETRADRFNHYVVSSLADRATPEAIRSYADFADFRASYNGIARYWLTRT
jgi:glyoxylase-like metal-dependent hydrolase (beta-lactamase superfamily II)